MKGFLKYFFRIQIQIASSLFISGSVLNFYSSELKFVKYLDEERKTIKKKREIRKINWKCYVILCIFNGQIRVECSRICVNDGLTRSRCTNVIPLLCIVRITHANI